MVTEERSGSLLAPTRRQTSTVAQTFMTQLALNDHRGFEHRACGYLNLYRMLTRISWSLSLTPCSSKETHDTLSKPSSLCPSIVGIDGFLGSTGY